MLTCSARTSGGIKASGDSNAGCVDRQPLMTGAFDSKMGGTSMKSFLFLLAGLPVMFSPAACLAASSHEAEYARTIGVFKHAGASSSFFSNSYAYAVFPNVRSGAAGIGGAYG